METPIDDRLREEARAHDFRYSCQHCAYFDADGPRCSEGFPHEPHLSSSLDGRARLIFCKRFELW